MQSKFNPSFSRPLLRRFLLSDWHIWLTSHVLVIVPIIDGLVHVGFLHIRKFEDVLPPLLTLLQLSASCRMPWWSSCRLRELFLLISDALQQGLNCHTFLFLLSRSRLILSSSLSSSDSSAPSMALWIISRSLCSCANR